MSAKERQEHLRRAIDEGGVIMTARGGLTREVPSSSTLARTPEEIRTAREDIERRRLQLEQEERRLAEAGGEEARGSDGRAPFTGGTGGSGGARTIEAKAGGDDLNALSDTQLRKRAKDAGVEGYATKNKQELIAAIQEKL